jgi:putative transposase
MPRRLRLQFEGAIYHVMSRGNGGQDIVLNDHDRERSQELVAAQVARSRWEAISFVLMTNHFHPLVRTHHPNLAHGMQRLLSAHARGMSVCDALKTKVPVNERKERIHV